MRPVPNTGSRNRGRASLGVLACAAALMASSTSARALTVDEIVAQLDALQRQGVPFEQLLESAVQGVHQLNPNFHWTGIYELFPDDVLRLGPYIGAPTEHCFIGVGRGVCGTAVAEKRNMNIPDAVSYTHLTLPTNREV